MRLSSFKSTACCFGEVLQLNLPTLSPVSPYCPVYKIRQSNWRPGLVCAVVVVCPFKPRKQAPAGCSPRNSSVLIMILDLNYYAVPRLFICSLSGYRPEEAQVCYLETRGALYSRSIKGLANFC